MTSTNRSRSVFAGGLVVVLAVLVAGSSGMWWRAHDDSTRSKAAGARLAAQLSTSRTQLGSENNEVQSLQQRVEGLQAATAQPSPTVTVTVTAVATASGGVELTDPTVLGAVLGQVCGQVYGEFANPAALPAWVDAFHELQEAQARNKGAGLDYFTPDPTGQAQQWVAQHRDACS